MQRNDPAHYPIMSRSGRHLMGETNVSWDEAEGGALRIMVDVCEPKLGVMRSIASYDFLRAPDGSIIGE